MWDGWSNYSAGLEDYSSPRKSEELRQQFLSDGTVGIALYCDLNEKPQAGLQLIESRHFTDSIISSPLITCPICTAKWLGTTKEPLSSWDHLIIQTTLQLIALRYFAWGAMVAVILLGFGMSIYMDSHPTTHSESLPQNAPPVELPCDVCKSSTAAKLRR